MCRQGMFKKTMRSAFILAMLAVAMLVTGVRSAQAFTITAVMDLQVKSITSDTASFDVLLTFPGVAGDQIESLQLSVLGNNDPLLTAGDTDFSRFGFTPDAATLATWLELSPLSTGLGFYAPADPFLGPFVLPSGSPQNLGDLEVDLTGLPANQALFVTLAGGFPGLDTDLAGIADQEFSTKFPLAVKEEERLEGFWG